MEILERNGSVLVKTGDDFDLKKIFECGQCFRWNEEDDGSYTGVAHGLAANVKREEGGFSVSGTLLDFERIWRDYFDLSRDYRALRKSVSVDDYMKAASDFGAGIRILNQDRWETLCSFIISQCNNIPRIKKIVETMSGLFGDEIYLGERKFYTFPGAETVASLEVEDLAPLRAGYRAPYIIAAAKAVSSGELDLDTLAAGDMESARRALMKMPGIGEKVANCVILFSLRMPKAFPVDVWMKKAIAENYPQGLDVSLFGENAGLAQQYMFYYQRERRGA